MMQHQPPSAAPPTANPFVRTPRPRGVSRWIPGLAALRTYQRSWLVAACIALLLLFAPALLQNLPNAILGAVVISSWPLRR